MWYLLDSFRNEYSVVPRPERNPCCWSPSCFSYHDSIRFMIMMIKILHIEDPICHPLYAVWSSKLPLFEPFQLATSREWLHDFGILCAFHFSLYKLVISLTNSSLCMADLTNAAGMLFADRPFFSFFIISCSSVLFGGSSRYRVYLVAF